MTFRCAWQESGLIKDISSLAHYIDNFGAGRWKFPVNMLSAAKKDLEERRKAAAEAKRLAEAEAKRLAEVKRAEAKAAALKAKEEARAKAKAAREAEDLGSSTFGNSTCCTSGAVSRWTLSEID